MTEEQKLDNFCRKLDNLDYECMSRADEGLYSIALFLKIREIMNRNLTKEQRLIIISKLLNEISDETDARR